MSLTAGIIGLPNVGKSTLFNAITKAKVLSANYPFATIEPNVGIVSLNDERLKIISTIMKSRKTVYTTFSFTDIAGLVKGASRGEGLGNQFLSHIRQVDAICHVVRCFDDKNISHIYNKIDPIDDIETINLELIFADLDLVIKRLSRMEKKVLLKVEANIEKEYNVLMKIKNALEAEIAVRDLALSSEELSLIQSYNLLTLKPIIYLLNISEKDLTEDNQYVKTVKSYAQANETVTITVCAKLEEELSELADDEKQEFLEELGIKESSLDKLSKEAYKLLGLQTFFTAGEKESRAWTFSTGMKAVECAGIIHSDFARGFIRAEVTSYDDFIKYGNLLNAKTAGKMRLEGKEYIVQDGDIMHFRFGG